MEEDSSSWPYTTNQEDNDAILNPPHHGDGLPQDAIASVGMQVDTCSLTCQIPSLPLNSHDLNPTISSQPNLSSTFQEISSPIPTPFSPRPWFLYDLSVDNDRLVPLLYCILNVQPCPDWSKSAAYDINVSHPPPTDDPNVFLSIPCDHFSSLIQPSCDLNLLTWHVFNLQPQLVSPNFTLLSFILQCFDRINSLLNPQTQPQTQPQYRPRTLLQNQAQTRFLSQFYSVLFQWLVTSLQFPDMFPISSAIINSNPLLIAREFVQFLFDQKISDIMLDRLFDQMSMENSHLSLTRFFSALFLELTSTVRANHISDPNYMKPYQTLQQLVQNEKIATLLVQLPQWLPINKTQRDLELRSIFGPFLRLRVLFDKESNDFLTAILHEAYFKHQHEIVVSCQKVVTQIIMLLMKGSKTRGKMIDWFVHALRRPRVMVQEDACSASYEFLLTIATCLLQCFDQLGGKRRYKEWYDQIGPECWIMNPRFRKVLLEDETRLSSPMRETNCWISVRLEAMKYELENGLENKVEEEGQDVEMDSNLDSNLNSDLSHNHDALLTECFHLILLALNFGVSPIYLRHIKLTQSCNELDHLIRQSGSDPNPFNRRNYTDLYRTNTDISLRLNEPNFLTSTFEFWELVCIWLVQISRLSIPIDHPYTYHLSTQPISTLFNPSWIPLPTVHMSFKTMPEFILDALIEFIHWSSELWPNFKDQDFTILVCSITTFISSSDYVGSHLSGRLIEPLSAMIPKIFSRHSHSDSNPSDPFEHPYVITLLGPSLSRLYVKMEHMGTPSGFYDKFNTRYYIATLMRKLWKNYGRAPLISLWQSDKQHFLAFVNMLINDTIYLLDEFLSILVKIQSHSTGHSNESSFDLDRYLRQVKIYFTLARETVRMLHFMSRDYTQPFMIDELMDRLATMLNSSISQLCVSAENLALSTKLKDECKFGPKFLLKKMMQIIFHFYNNTPLFARSLARDQRIYSSKAYMQVRNVVESKKMATKEELIVLDRLITETQQYVDNDKSLEEKLGEIPDEFLDAIMLTLMKDPVKLPSSSVILDRATIERHLLSDSSDPFNRQPLKVDQLIPMPHLQKKIQDFVANRLQS